uniref:Uncharacterized protein n=1 Tax=Manihot esculenta TaxID=3983 RepID=A0A2C9VE13_MANES
MSHRISGSVLNRCHLQQLIQHPWMDGELQYAHPSYHLSIEIFLFATFNTLFYPIC